MGSKNKSEITGLRSERFQQSAQPTVSPVQRLSDEYHAPQQVEIDALWETERDTSRQNLAKNPDIMAMQIELLTARLAEMENLLLRVIEQLPDPTQVEPDLHMANIYKLLKLAG